MSQNVFLIDPIFFMPIDEEYYKRKGKPNKADKTESQKIKNMVGLNQNQDLGIIKDNHPKKIISFLKENKSSSNSSQNNNQSTIIFSSTKNNRNIKSMSNSSKIYISEIFKRNWKLKSRRLIAKLKKKLIKKWTQTYNKEGNGKNVNINKNCSNNKIIINSQSNNINNYDYEFDNYYINTNNIKNSNTVLKNNFYNNINDFINLQNACKNIKFGYTNDNTNLNICNLVYNYNKIPNLNFNFIGKDF